MRQKIVTEAYVNQVIYYHHAYSLCGHVTFIGSKMKENTYHNITDKTKVRTSCMMQIYND